VLRWFVFYGMYLLAGVVALAVLISAEHWTWDDWTHNTAETFANTSPALKLVGFLVYISLATTFLPLPTGWIVAGVATREAAVAAGWSDGPLAVLTLTTLTVATIGATGSVIANLTDYHLFTWMLRSHRIAKVRSTRAYLAAARWFERSPFWILVIFNIIPIPVDVVRMLATTHRYPRVPFAAANFIGRFIRYAVIAYVTYRFNLGWIAVVALLAVAVVLGVMKIIPRAARKFLSRIGQPQPR